MADDKRTALAEDEPDPLQGLQAVRRMRTEAERLESVMVRRARNNGASWAQIATVLGVSKQAVHKKHGGKGR
ncbi:hypothetical protein [Glycomyces sp. NPDC021274]|jgi:hypothetical protein|uniref:helix-turn-helix domain-containing protein n=1 Tax=Glycomyces sp. NPDC021274 TaxID=3155120 RepID=UPI0033E730F2